MANNAGAPQGGQLMYYYVAVPQAGGSGQPYVQGQEGMQTAQFDASGQVPGFVPNQGAYGGYGEQEAASMGGVPAVNMGHMQPTMMAPTGQGGQMVPGQMMLVTTMMQPNQNSGAPSMGQPQAPSTMEQTQDSSQGNQWGSMNTQQQAPPRELKGAHDAQQSSQPPSTRTPTQGSKAFKIVNPHTKEEVNTGKEGADAVAGGAGGGSVGGGGGGGGSGGRQEGQ